MMRFILCLLVLTIALPAWASTPKARSQTLKFEKAIDSATIQASGKTISLWGVKPIPSTSPYAWASKLFLESTLKRGTLKCTKPGSAGDNKTMHCYVDKSDIGSLLVQMGLATAATPYYKGEEIIAQMRRRGVWKTENGTDL